MNNPFTRRRTLTPAFIATWKAYTEANARVADMYEAVPISHARDGSRIARCPCGAIAVGLCRACRKEES